VRVKTMSLRSFFSRLSSLKSSTKFLSDTILLMLLSFICTNISRKYLLRVSCYDTFETKKPPFKSP
jgi:multisubunit Na+/H+ antiporter MnhF subunit